ncbi:MAG: hypothetical protein WDO68_24265 [Gammaproteobacteria bacterium]
MDMAIEPARWPVIETLKGLVSSGTVPTARIDDAVTRILRVKWAMGRGHQAKCCVENESDVRQQRRCRRRTLRSSGSAECLMRKA